MKNELLRSYAALALDSILTNDDVTYSRLNRSALYFRIQEEHTEIEKEISFALENVWNEIKDYEKASLLRKAWLRIVQTFQNGKGSAGIPIHVLESIVDTMLPDIVAFFETDDGKHEFEEWKAERHRAEIIHHYDALIDENNDPVHDLGPLKKHMDGWDGDIFIEELELSKRKTVLEIGVGTGRLAVKTAPQSYAFYGIDLSPKTIERAKENLAGIEDVNLICGDFLTYEFDRTFDIVYSSLTFMHIKEKQAAIGKAACLLSENGRFVLSIEKSQATLLEYGKRKIEIYPDNPDRISKYMEAAGLTKIEQKETEFAYILIGEK